MPLFSTASQAKLDTCDKRLQKIFQEVVKHYDCTVIEGHRSEEKQNEYYRTGKSKVRYPSGKHNSTPSLAVDVAPCPIDWGDVRRFDHFAGFVQAVALSQGVTLRWGGDWNMNLDFKDQTFNDLPHFEIME